MPTVYPADSKKAFCEVCNNTIVAKHYEPERHKWLQNPSDRTKELFACLLMQH